MALYLKELALLETTTNTLLKLTNVLEGVDGAAAFGYKVEQEKVTINAGQSLPVKETHTLDVRVIDDYANQATLVAWANAPELYRFKASAYSGDSFLIWDEPVQIVFSRQRDGIAVRRLLMTTDAVVGYSGTQPLVKAPAYAGQNALSLYKTDQGSSTLLNGFTKSGTMTTAVSGSAMTATRGADATAFVISQPILFPFDGVQLEVSAFITGATAGSYTVGMRFLDSASAEISVTSTTFTPDNIRRGVAATTPTGTYYIQWYGAPGSTLGNDLVFNAPAIRLGFDESYVF